MTIIEERDLGTPAPDRNLRQPAPATVSVVIDGLPVTVPEGTSVMRAAALAGTDVPKLCATDRLDAFGSCRLCVVEIDGRKGTPASCTTPVADGMHVTTQSPKLERLRRGVMELYISDHPLDCLTCAANGDCELQDMAGAVGLRDVRYGYDGENHFDVTKGGFTNAAFTPPDTSNPYFTFEPSKCIVCSRCVRACEEIQGTFALTIEGRGFAQPNPRPMFPNPPGLLRLEPHSEGLRDRIWWGAGSRATAGWAAAQGMNLMSSTLLTEATGDAFADLQAEQIERYRAAWRAAGHEHTPRVSVSRSIFPLINDVDRSYFGLRGQQGRDQVGVIDGFTSTFGKTYAAEPDELIEQLKGDAAVQAADTVMLTIPTQLGVDYNLHVLNAFAEHVAPALGWRPNTDGPVEGYPIGHQA